MKWTDFFADDKTGKGSSARLIFIICALVGIICISFSYLWVIIHGASFDSTTMSYSAFILALAGKVSFDKYVAYKHGGSSNANNPT